MRYLTKEGHTVLDPFVGSGTTAVACKELGRNCISIEKEKEYVDMARKRVKAVPEKLGKFVGGDHHNK